MRFVPRSVMVGFVNALAILIFLAQVPHLIGVPWLVYPLVAVGMAVMVVLPQADQGGSGPAGRDRAPHRRHGAAAIAVPTVGDEGKLPDSLPACAAGRAPDPATPCLIGPTRSPWPWSA